MPRFYCRRKVALEVKSHVTWHCVGWDKIESNSSIEYQMTGGNLRIWKTTIQTLSTFKSGTKNTLLLNMEPKKKTLFSIE